MWAPNCVDARSKPIIDGAAFTCRAPLLAGHADAREGYIS
jgi:hypothetical protein